MKIFRRKKEHKGLIKYFDLHSFWDDELNEEEKLIVFENFCKGSMGIDQSYLLEKELIAYGSKLNFIGGQITRYIKTEYRSIGYKFIDLGKQEILLSNNILDKHFYYTSLIKFYYRQSSEKEDFNLAVRACKDGISISKEAKHGFKLEYENDFLPRHLGYEQLSIILEKKKNYSESIKLCENALEEGWNGDWNKRIHRMKIKLKKL